MESLYERHGKKKIYWVIAVILIVLNIITWIMACQSRKSFSIDGQKFKYKSQSDKTILFKDKEDNPVIVTIEEDSYHNYPLQAIAEKYKVEYKDKIIGVDCSNIMERGIIVTLSNGKEYMLSPIVISIHGEREYMPFDVELVYNINSVYDFIQEGSSPMLLILTIPLILLGLVSVMYPEEMWEFEHIFTVKDGEPTDWAISSSKIGGVLIICLAFIISLSLIEIGG